jgi:putative Mg2+ transporter-C (MgtC) family protein
MMSVELVRDSPEGDASRVAAQIVTGIGFLGAGAILRTGAGVRGLTTAATIWVNAAIGMAVGGGEYALAIAATAATLLALTALTPLDRHLDARDERRRAARRADRFANGVSSPAERPSGDRSEDGPSPPRPRRP